MGKRGGVPIKLVVDVTTYLYPRPRFAVAAMKHLNHHFVLECLMDLQAIV